MLSLNKHVLKYWLKRTPFLRFISKFFYFTFIERWRTFPGSKNYWINRYQSGGTSGSGSYDKFAIFKAEVLNNFVRNNHIETIIEYGCGDGSQLLYSKYPSYLGFDISTKAIQKCKNIFSNDYSKTFKLLTNYQYEFAELTLSIDVIYHLIEYETFLSHMILLFDSSTRFVIIYSSNTDRQAILQGNHIRHRDFSKWIKHNKPEWELIEIIPNRYPYTGLDIEGSFASFYIYKKSC